MVNIISESNNHINEGYLMVDHRASPGLTPEQAIALGYSPGQVSEGQLLELKTNHCCHCGTVVIVNPDRIRERAFCQLCNKYICDICGLEQRLPNYVHKTYTQQLEEGLTFYSNLKEQ
jgi:hypothetical protein